MPAIRVITGESTAKIEFRAGETLLALLQRGGYPISASCGGFGKCGKCALTVEFGGVRETRLACRTEACEGMTVYLDADSAADKAEILPSMQTDGADGTGLVVDIGTTTLAFYFLDLKTGRALSVRSILNPQRSFGADVISRISFADANGIEPMQRVLSDAIRAEIAAFSRESGRKLRTLAVTGNTVMLHIFAGEPISSFGRYPFTPVFLEKRVYEGRELGYDAEKVVLLPSFASFVGADIVCGAIAAELETQNAILVDLGTNGEILMHCGNSFFATSVAAGPAFEGADIECGMGGVKGAVCAVRKGESGTILETIGNEKASGICGAGLIDAVACMLDEGIIDETGAFELEGDRWHLTDTVYISAKDVRKFQLAKSAVRSGLEILLARAEEAGARIDKLYICGGLGAHIREESALRVGLIPESLRGRIFAAGNTAGLGACMCMLRAETMDKAQALARRCEILDLATNPDFMDLFAENMLF
ncbi:MAG: DUF4445 domain-containing protein [Oscillospiraceae bacterium]|nr:DUF4445 domain-containing protein [Oscillospiraceae bacterium]